MDLVPFAHWGVRNEVDLVPLAYWCVRNEVDLVPLACEDEATGAFFKMVCRSVSNVSSPQNDFNSI